MSCRRAVAWSLGVLVAASLLTIWSIAPVAANDKYASMVVDANTGEVLRARYADSLRYPASLTKIMTLYIVFEELRAGRLKPTTPIRFSEYAAGRPPSKLGVKAGESITLDTAIRALVTKSANDVAAAVAEHIAGSVPAFARRMTATARRIGMSKTTYRNASGLPDDGQTTTARDMVTLGLRIMRDFPEEYAYFSIKSFTFRGRTYRNHNRLLRTYAGTDGIKTGYIRASGFNLLASVHRGDKHLIGVVFGGRTASRRDAHMKAILDDALPQAVAMSKPVPVTPPPRPKPQMVASAAPAPAASPVRSGRAGSEASPPLGVVRLAMVATPPRNRELPLAVPESRPTRSPAVMYAAAAGRAGLARSVARAASTRSRVADGSAWRTGGAITSGAPSGRSALAAAYGPVVGTQEDEGDAIERLIAAAMRSISDAAEPAAPAPSSLVLPEKVDAPAPAGTPIRHASAVTAAAPEPEPEPVEYPEGWQIQVGAYADAKDARDRLSVVKEAARDLLEQAAPFTQPVEKESGTLYRARFAGLDKSDAERACRALKKKDIDCFVLTE